MNALASFLDFSAESDPFSLRSPLCRERVLERLIQCLHPDVAKGFFLRTYPGSGPLIGIHEGDRFRLFLRPGWFSGFEGDFQGEVVEDGLTSRINGSFREPAFALAAYLQKRPRTIRGSSTGFVLFLLPWAGSIIYWAIQGFHADASFPVAACTGLFPIVLGGHWFCLSSCRRGRKKILMELATIAESNDTPWTIARPRKQR